MFTLTEKTILEEESLLLGNSPKLTMMCSIDEEDKDEIMMKSPDDENSQ